jgi:hypothetical protein
MIPKRQLGGGESTMFELYLPMPHGCKQFFIDHQVSATTGNPMLIPKWLAEGSACFPKLKARFSRGASWNSPEAEIEVELNYPTGDVAGLLIPRACFINRFGLKSVTYV